MLGLDKVSFRDKFPLFLMEWNLILCALLLPKAACGEDLYGVHTITSKNFRSLVIDSPTPEVWIVCVNTDISVEKEVHRSEFELRGLLIRVGLIDPKKDNDLLKKQGFLDKSSEWLTCRVYPYGGWKIKTAGHMDVNSFAAARMVAIENVPDRTQKVSDMKDLEGFVHTSLQTSPPRFPVLLFIDKRETPVVYKALALKYSTYFHFGVARKPSKDLMQKFGVTSLPKCMVLLSTLTSNKQLTFSAIPYEYSYGPVSYMTIAKFLYSVHEKHWKDLPMMEKYRGEINLKEVYTADGNEIFKEVVKNNVKDEL
ncbi:putative protein disulfide-isomerase DDB_G0275025 [Nematostella vectensis]|uniref:putative protein disulfide-isomerase DDB_G0275025 n=1 Tax=Nematostella vectensis TaxID=45351 RepID=UPI00207710C6|nr:putative protein disulfide-isomerase DDB_G0275025 [Nematostella vectensis]